MVKDGKTQAFLEVRDTDLKKVYEAHSDFREHYTFFPLEEPVGDELLEILKATAKGIENYYSVKVDHKAIDFAIKLTNQYRAVEGISNRAQPERSRLLIDRAMSKYCLYAHSKPAMIDELVAKRQILLCEPSGKEADAKIKEIDAAIERHNKEFAENQALIKKYFAAQRDGEKKIIVLEQEIAKLVNAEISVGNASPKDDLDLDAATGYSTPAVEEKRKVLEQLAAAVKVNREKYEAITEKMNADLLLTAEHVINEFSRISGIDASKLKQDDKAKLIALGPLMKKRIFGQDDALQFVWDSVKIWRRGRQTGLPLPYLFCGPSGVGKTEIGRTLALGLFDTVFALNKFDMGEFMEKNDTTKLIGAPPGYDGFDVGGQMTNSVRANPHQVMLQDEVEKAHQSVFNIYLGILDEGYCKDNLGRRCEFGNVIMPFTTNIGQEHMLRVGTGEGMITREEAYELTMIDLQKFFKPEFLNRFNGRENIIILDRLELESMRKIAQRELDRINAYYAPNITSVFPEDQLNSFCTAAYSPKMGARGIPGKIKSVEKLIVDKQLIDEDYKGLMNINYDSAKQRLLTAWSENERQAA